MDNFRSSSLVSKYAQAGIDSLSLAIKAAQEKKISDSREFFEQLVDEFPSCGRFWKIYIEQELKARNFELVEKLFQRSLIKVLNIDLWKCYLNYVRDTKVKMANYKEKTAQAYDFALDKIGLDVMSYSIWVDYVNFLKSIDASGSFAENQKITAIRKVYQKGVMNPMLNIEQLWKDYCIFENLINPLIAKRMIDDRSKEFITVRKIAKEYENVTRNLERNMPSLSPQGTQDETKQKQLWKKYIQWEKSNPLKLEESLLAKRILFALEQSLLCMSAHPDICLEAVLYLQQQSITMTEKCEIAMSKFYAEETAAMYERLTSKGPMSTNVLVYFTYADYEESRLNYQKVSQIYDKLISIKEIDPSLCYIQYMRFLRRAEGIRSARNIFKKAREDSRISYHVFVAAALIEYFCTKDKTIANKIFQLGCKTFGHVTEYLLAYIEFVTHLNEDDVMRSLFENVLSNNQLSTEKAGELWTEWLEFENNVGDLNNIERVELKRKSFYSESGLNERQTLLLIDKYKFMNMYPVNELELKTLGYSDSCLSETTGVSNMQVLNGSNSEHEQQKTIQTTDIDSSIQKPSIIGFQSTNSSNPFNKLASHNSQGNFPQPDMRQMLPWKSKNAFNGVQPIPGGGMFLFPSIIAEMIHRLPPPTSFDGPYVIVDEFISNFKNINILDDYQQFAKQQETILSEMNEEKLNNKTESTKNEEESDVLNSDLVNKSLSPKSASKSLNLPPKDESQVMTLKRPFLNQQNTTEHSGDEENLGPDSQHTTHHKKQIKKA